MKDAEQDAEGKIHEVKDVAQDAVGKILRKMLRKEPSAEGKGGKLLAFEEGNCRAWFSVHDAVGYRLQFLRKLNVDLFRQTK